MSSDPRPLKRVLIDARQSLGMNQRELAEAMGVSSRTIIRWQHGQSEPVEAQVHQLAAMVREEDEELADELLTAASVAPAPRPQADVTPAGAEPKAPAPPVAPPSPSFALTPPVAAPSPSFALAPAAAGPSQSTAPAPAHMIDAIVCSAADAANLLPRAVRPALRAAFARARELGISVEAAERGLDDAVRRPRDSGSGGP